MPFSYAELEKFYEELVGRARACGVICAITSGMACVAFGVSATTKDCDLLCSSDSAGRLLDLLNQSALGQHLPAYRGNLSAPLDSRWLGGGWTSHFLWPPDDSGAFLDVFGVAPRGSGRWEREIDGSYANPHTVAEMKRTSRDKDWPFVTALGARMIAAGDSRGWLHIFDENLLRTFRNAAPQRDDLTHRRPLLKLAEDDHPSLRPALRAEIEYWHELDRIRLTIYERAARRYTAAVRKLRIPKTTSLLGQHGLRVKCAEEFLPANPLRDYGVDRMIAEARASLAEIANPAALAWLPDVREHFKLLTA